MKLVIIEVIRNVAAYITACYIAGLIIGRLYLVLLPNELGGLLEDSHTAQSPLSEAYFVGTIISALMIVPTLCMISIAYGTGLRPYSRISFIYYVGSSAAWAVALSAIIFHRLDMATFVFAVGGVAAGMVYWLIAGGNVNLWSRPEA